jgi:hypothetical protein
MKRWFLHIVLSWLTGLKSEDFTKVFSWVYEAEHTKSTSEAKRSLVDERIKGLWPKLAGWAVNLIRELAVGYLKKTLAA